MTNFIFNFVIKFAKWATLCKTNESCKSKL